MNWTTDEIIALTTGKDMPPPGSNRPIAKWFLAMELLPEISFDLLLDRGEFGGGSIASHSYGIPSGDDTQFFDLKTDSLYEMFSRCLDDGIIPGTALAEWANTSAAKSSFEDARRNGSADGVATATVIPGVSLTSHGLVLDEDT